MRKRTASGTASTWAPNWPSSMVRLLAGQPQRDGLGPRGVVGRHVHRIDHVLDEEEAPPARLLVAGELALDVRDLGVRGDGSGQASIGDPDDDVLGGRGDLDVEWHVRIALAA